MSLAFNRYQRQRIIAKRLKRIKWTGWVTQYPGWLCKNNTVCSCHMCRDTKYRDYPRVRRVEEDDWVQIISQKKRWYFGAIIH